jgi:hypothetical protein
VSNVILVFPSNSGTMIATKTLRDSGVAAKVIPMPASVKSASSLCLSIELAAEVDALEALRRARVSPSSVVR